VQSSVGHVSIRCLEPDAKYLLQFDGVDVSEIVRSVGDAMKRAGELVVEETRFTIYDEAGEGLITGRLFPHEF